MIKICGGKASRRTAGAFSASKSGKHTFLTEYTIIRYRNALISPQGLDKSLYFCFCRIALIYTDIATVLVIYLQSCT